MKYFLALLLSLSSLFAADQPAGNRTKMLGYSLAPNRYVDDHAAEVSRLYDGFFFSIGTWENARARFEGPSPKDAAWLDVARRNVASLRKAGATENFLTVAFGDSAPWPSPGTLLSPQYTETMAAEYAALARTARALGFKGLCIDVEYPFPRYELGHAIYTYQGYTAADLLRSARNQGRAIMAAILAEFPDAVILSLPGDAFRTRPVGRELSLGLLDVMAELDAPGGFHLGSEFTYSLNDTVAHLAHARFEDAAMHRLVSPRTLDYWRRRCTIAPGMWPLHMVETEGKTYPVQPWAKEMAELTEQFQALHASSKRYVWSYTGNPVWYLHTPELEARYGLKKQNLKFDDVDLKPWHDLLASRLAAIAPIAPRYQPLLDAIHSFDQAKLSPEQLCARFGSIPRWWVLGYTSHVLKQPQYTAEEALLSPVDPHQTWHGRDSAIRWFQYDALDPRGFVNPRRIFDYHSTDAAGAHFRTFAVSPATRKALLHLGWDDIITVRLNGQTVFDTRSSDKPVKGALYQDRYLFERTFPITLQQGANQLDISSYNSHGVWVFATRLTAPDGLPFSDLDFTLAPAGPLTAERQLTTTPVSHSLDNNDNFSPDGRFLVYDIRDTAGEGPANSTAIMKVEIATGRESDLYRPPSATGANAAPGVLAASYSPVANEVVFIHGPLLSETARLGFYSQTNRRGAVVSGEAPADGSGRVRFLDCRDVESPVTPPGAHRGGTHRHEYSADGQRIGFTYDDQLLRNYGRNLGMLVPHPKAPCGVSHYFTTLLNIVPTADARPGDLVRAADDSWVGPHGLMRAFIGTTKDESGRLQTHLYVVDIPANIDVTTATSGDRTHYPTPPKGLTVRRLAPALAPGIVRGSPDGKRIAYYARDAKGVRQVFVIDAQGGEPVQVTHLEKGAASGLRWHPSGNYIAVLSDDGVAVSVTQPGPNFGRTIWLTTHGPAAAPAEALVWSPDGRTLAFNRRVPTYDAKGQLVKDAANRDFRQIFLVNFGDGILNP